LNRISLLSDALFTVRRSSVMRSELTLPDLLSHLGRGEDLEPLALRPHQQHAWHAFLVQLAALVAHRTGDRSLERSSEAWRQAVLDLSGGAGESAWSLVETDLARPAFLQPPVPEASLESFRNRAHEPDALDVLITAKNHDVKADRITSPRPEHWLYALVTLQTMEGFLGRGNYGIARMNGGFASRPALAAAPGLHWAERFRRDVAVWLDRRPELLEHYGYAPSGGHALLWLEPWDGKKGGSLQDCDPFFLEICRRVRFVEEQGRFSACLKPTEAARLEAKEQRGNTGDVWTPIRIDSQGATALTVGSEGFSYRLMSKLLLTSEFPWKPALTVRREDGQEPVFVAQVLVRGQGKTDGYRERRIPLPPRARARLFSPETSDQLGSLASLRVEQARKAQRSVLLPALCSLLQGGADKLDLRDDRARPWLERFDEEVDRIFFPALWEAVEQPRAEHESAWNETLRALAEVQLQDAIRSAPSPLARRPRAVARAEILFRRTARSHLPTLEPSQPTPTEARP